jgi:hypothetical protein
MFARKGLRAYVYGHFVNQARFAEAVGMDQGWISRLIHCQADPTEEQARRIMGVIRESDPDADMFAVFRRYQLEPGMIEERDPATGLPLSMMEEARP